MNAPDPREVAEAKFLLIEATDGQFDAWLNDEATADELRGEPTMSAPNNELCFRCGHERRHHGFKCGDPSHDHGPLSCNERATTPDGRATVPICPCHEFLPEPRPKVAAMRICEYCGSSLRAEQYYRQLPDDHQPVVGNQP